MKKIVTKIILSAVVAAMAALLLAGCREGMALRSRLRRSLRLSRHSSNLSANHADVVGTAIAASQFIKFGGGWLAVRQNGFYFLVIGHVGEAI